MLLFKDPIDAKKLYELYSTQFVEDSFGKEDLELLENGIFPFECDLITKNIIFYIDKDKLETGLYKHMKLNDLVYNLHYQYGVPLRRVNHKLQLEIPIKEFQLIIEYSEHLFQKFYGISRLEREEYEELENQYKGDSYEEKFKSIKLD